jgi:hypothetical protein
MLLDPGTRLGPYEIIGSIGAGGMGEVYRARDTRLDRIVAIKILPQGLAGDPAARERFEREARTISQINHSHICTLHDVGHQVLSTGSGQAVDYLVLEYLEGETLASLVSGSWPDRDVRSVRLQPDRGVRSVRLQPDRDLRVSGFSRTVAYVVSGLSRTVESARVVSASPGPAIWLERNDLQDFRQTVD